MPLRAVTLDVGWTLAYPRESLWEIFADVCRQAGVSVAPADIETFVRSVWNVGQQRMEEELRAGGQYSDSDEQFTAQFRFLGELVFRHLGVTGSTDLWVEEFLRRFWHPDRWQLFPDVFDAIGALRAKNLRVGVVSNAPTGMITLLERLDLLDQLDYVVISAAEGVRKPDKRIFLRALQCAGTEAAETAHIGDMYIEDILGGRSVGLTAFLIERGKNALFPSYPESEGRDLPREHVVHNLEQFVQAVVQQL